MLNYPIKFRPITQYRIWGGNKLNAFVPKELQLDRLGEIWSLSAVKGAESVVVNGPLKGRNLQELLDTQAERLMGSALAQKYGTEFPLLIKFIDAAEALSVQVHPNDEQARALHDSFGKSEMWYIVSAEPDAELTIGFKSGVDAEAYQTALANENLESVLNQIPVEKGDAVYIPAGRVHAIGAGIVLAEIQQTSDVTYRIYDYNRLDKDGQKRELHTDLALKAIDFNPIDEIKTAYRSIQNEMTELVVSPYFKTQIFKGKGQWTVSDNQNMRIFVCTGGEIKMKTADETTVLTAYESLLIPACLANYEVEISEESELIEVEAN